MKLLSMCDGPDLVVEMPSEQNAALADPLTEERIEVCRHGKTVAVDRLVLYPVRREDLPRVEEPLPDAALVGLLRGNVIAIQEEVDGDEGVILAQVDENHAQQQLLGVYPMEGVGRMRLRDRQWKLTREARMVGYAEVVSRITLEPTGVLTTASIEELLARGVSI